MMVLYILVNLVAIPCTDPPTIIMVTEIEVK